MHVTESSFTSEGTHEGSNAREERARYVVSREAPISQPTQKRREGDAVNVKVCMAHEEGVYNQGLPTVKK